MQEWYEWYLAYTSDHVMNVNDLSGEKWYMIIMHLHL